MHIIALGANLPTAEKSPSETLDSSLVHMAREGLPVLRRSRWYRTPAWPSGSGPDYVNGVAVVRSDRTPEDVLAALHVIEAALGRRRDVRWGARVCDLDLIASGSEVRPDAGTVREWIARTGEAQLELPPGLILPHPRMHGRAFVLVPLLEVAPDWTHPVLGRNVRQLVDGLPQGDRAAVIPLS